MGGRGASSGRSGGVLRKNARPVSLTNEKHGSSGGIWRHTILEAEPDGRGGISLSYASPTSYEHPNRNTTIAHYEVSHGIWSGQPGNRSTQSTGINWKSVTSVSGKTYDVQNFLQEKGFRWNRTRRRYEKQ